MTYARARLWLGISGVGSLVLLASCALAFELPTRWLNAAESGLPQALGQLAAVTALVVCWLLPFDFLGGYWLPTRYGRSHQRFSEWLRGYAIGVPLQASLFLVSGGLILCSSRAWGLLGALAAILVGMLLSILVRGLQIRWQRVDTEEDHRKLVDAMTLIQSWRVFVPQTILVSHRDVGFTGGIVGLGKRVKIVIPQAWLEFSVEQLAMAIARRALAIESGSYRRGVVTAVVWNTVGFLLCSLMPQAGLVTVAGLVTTVCWFTLWSFIGLLVLPTVSRNASLKIDQLLAQRGASADWIQATASSMDQLQDGEPERPPLIETIFHPIPSVSRRGNEAAVARFGAWNVARTTLFLSWGCLGFLSRAVHCNVGRPELWTMLPSD